jgi:hypothetical protein
VKDKQAMKLTAKYDMEAPAAFVFGQLIDFDGWERAAMRRGADVMRTDKLAQIGPGASWGANFRYRGKPREVTIRLDTLTPISTLGLTGISKLADGVMVVEVLNLGASRTRLDVRLEIKPKTIAARIYVQSLRLARARVERSFAQRIAQLAAEIDDRHRAARAAGR